MTLPTLIYDGNYLFCAECAKWFASRSSGTIRPSKSYSDAELADLGLSRKDVDLQVWWAKDHENFGGADAIGRALLITNYPLLGRFLIWRAVLPLSRKIYKFVSSHRSWFSSLLRKSS